MPRAKTAPAPAGQADSQSGALECARRELSGMHGLVARVVACLRLKWDMPEDRPAALEKWCDLQEMAHRKGKETGS